MKEILKNPPFASYRRDTADLDMAVALIPIAVWAVFIFSWRVLALVLTGALSCLFLEAAVSLILYKKIAFSPLSPIVIGALIALSLPHNAPLWALFLGCAAAILVAKYPLIFFCRRGGLLSPVALGMLVSSLLCRFSEPFLDSFRAGAMPDDGLLHIFIGNTDGAVGKVSVLLVILSGLYLVIRRVISPRVILSAVIVFAALSLALYPEWTTYTDNLIYQMLCGGFLFCLVFVAGNRISAPFTATGQLLYGALFALLTFALRCYTDFPQPELLSASVLSLLSPLADTFLKGSPFGGKRKI